MLFSELILEAFIKRHMWVVDGSRLHKAKYLWYLGLWGQPEGNHMAATQSYMKATGRPWGRDRIFIFSKEVTWTSLKENKLHVGNDANKKKAWSIKWNHEALMPEWTLTLGLGTQGWNLKEVGNSGILRKTPSFVFHFHRNTKRNCLTNLGWGNYGLGHHSHTTFPHEITEGQPQRKEDVPKEHYQRLACLSSGALSQKERLFVINPTRKTQPTEIWHEAVLLGELVCLTVA